MRHSRRAVMAEQYKLYIKRNVLNGRYFIRNMQIVLGFLITLAVLIGASVLINSKGGFKNSTSDADGVHISAKDALFGNNDVTEAELSADNNMENIGLTADQQVTYDAAAYGTAEGGYSAGEVTEDIVETVDSISEINASADENTVNDVNVDETEADKEDTDGSDDVIVNADEAEISDSDTDEGEFADKCIANVEETLNIRKEPGRDAEFVGMMSQGSIAKVLGSEGEWTKIKSGDVEGYVLSEYILTGEVAERFSRNYVTIQGKATEDGVNIREDRSTDANILKVLEKDDIVSVVELPEDEENDSNKTKIIVDDSKDNASDDIKWVTVMMDDGQIGYVSQDYVDIDKLYTLAVSAEELKRREEERAAAERAAAEAAILAAQQTAASAASYDNSSSYHGATTTPVTAASSGESLGTFYITAYCGCSKCSSGHNKTASGTTPTQGRTIAADTSILPFGTQVVIDGIVYTVEDRGSGVTGNHIDIFFATHEDAMAYGSKSVTVYKY